MFYVIASDIIIISTGSIRLFQICSPICAIPSDLQPFKFYVITSDIEVVPNFHLIILDKAITVMTSTFLCWIRLV